MILQEPRTRAAFLFAATPHTPRKFPKEDTRVQDFCYYFSSQNRRDGVFSSRRTPMFEQSCLEYAEDRRGVAALFSFGIQLCALSLLVLLPMLYTHPVPKSFLRTL